MSNRLAQHLGGKAPHVAVVGGGLAGLAAAVELTTRGADVTLVESNQHLGGKMNVLEAAGYTFDMGPTILTLPEVVCGVLRRAGRDVASELDLVRLDPQWRCHYEDGAVLDLRDDPDDTAAELETKLPGTDAAAGYRRLLDYSRRLERLSRAVFFYKDLGGIADLIRQTPVADKQVMSDAARMRLHATVGRTIHKLVAEPHVRQMAEHFLQYVGSNPFLAPTILTMIAAAQQDNGCWYAMGGTRRVAQALEAAARDAGVRLVLGTPVTRIEAQGGRARGVQLSDGRFIDADAVVSNCDVQRTLGGLVHTSKAAAAADRIAKRYEPACSGVVLYLGLDRRYEHLAHHNFLFSRDPHQEFDDIYRRGIPTSDPTLYVAAPSVTDPDQAPPGGEALYVLIHTPYTRPGSLQADADRLLAEYRPVVIDKLERMGMPDLEQHIVVERSLLPPGIDKMYNATGGAIYGLASHGRLRGGFKPRNSSPVLDGLYLAGGSVNPGPGVPMVIMSGVTAADAAARDLGLPAADLVATSGSPAKDEYVRAPVLQPQAA
jgi:phytoene desaturase